MITPEQEYRAKLLRGYLPHNGRALGIGDEEEISRVLCKLKPKALCLLYGDLPIPDNSINVVYSFGTWPADTYVEAHLDFVNRVLISGGYVMLEAYTGQIDRLRMSGNWEMLGGESISAKEDGEIRELCLFRVYKPAQELAA